MIKINVEQGSEAWHEARMGRITATDFNALMMKESTAGFQNLIYRVVGELISGDVEETYSNDAMERGKALEPAAVAEFEEITGIKTEQIGFCIPDEGTEFHNWIGCSPDRLLPDNGLLEVKCPLIKAHLGYIEENVMPSEYFWQVQAQLYITGFDYALFMSFYPEVKPFIIKVLPDLETFDKIEARLGITIDLIQQKLLSYKKYTYINDAP
jgi:putative phage-type endonuclease